MADSFGRVIAIIVAVFILFIFPTKNEFERQDETSRMFALTEITRFVDSVRSTGYITPVMYRELYNRLTATNNVYEVKMEHYKKKYSPNITSPLSPPAIPAAGYDFSVNYDGSFTEDIMKTLFPSSGTGTAYHFSKGDYFAVSVTNKNKTMATKIQEMLYNADFSTERIIVRYGGMIKDEDY